MFCTSQERETISSYTWSSKGKLKWIPLIPQHSHRDAVAEPAPCSIAAASTSSQRHAPWHSNFSRKGIFWGEILSFEIISLKIFICQKKSSSPERSVFIPKEAYTLSDLLSTCHFVATENQIQTKEWSRHQVWTRTINMLPQKKSHREWQICGSFPAHQVKVCVLGSLIVL